MLEALPEVLPGPAVTLRRYRMSDAAVLKEALTASHEHLRAWMPWALEPPTDASVMEFLKPSVEAFGADGNANYAITRTDDGTYVGGCGLHDRFAPDALEIGYWVDVRHVRCGIATAAARLLTDACFAFGRHRAVIRCDAANEPSAGVPRKLGYRLDEIQTTREPRAASETDQLMVWVKERAIDRDVATTG